MKRSFNQIGAVVKYPIIERNGLVVVSEIMQTYICETCNSEIKKINPKYIWEPA